jgi:signal recognition particle GTPase
VSQSPTTRLEEESPSRQLASQLRKWRSHASKGSAVLARIAKEAKAPIDAYEHLRRRLTGEDVGGSISKRVVAQLERSERAYKGWETRLSKEQDDGRPEAEAGSEG